MGGVLERERSTLIESVPVLGDIPYLGTLFRRRTEIDTPRYLLIFVTATIVKDSGEFLVYGDTNAPPGFTWTNAAPSFPPATTPTPAAPAPANAPATNGVPAGPPGTNSPAPPK